MDQPHHRYAALDGLRGFAAVAVVLTHCGHHLRVSWLAGHGGFAVDVFFVMSGFVLHRAYEPRLRNGWSARDFASARLTRLYPLYGLGLLTGLAVLSAYVCRAGSPEALPLLLSAFIRGSLLIPDLSEPRGQMFVLDAPCWSLLVEAVVSAGYVLGLGRIRAPGLAVLIGASAAGLAAVALQGSPLLAAGPAETLGTGLLRGTFGFAVGVAVACAERRGRLRTVARCPVWPAFGLLGLFVLVPDGRFGSTFELLGIVVASPVIVGLCAAGRRPPGSGRWCTWSGLLSYPLYILHTPVLFWVARVELPRWGFPPGAAPWIMLATAGSCVGMALAIGLWVEPRLVGALRGAIGTLFRTRGGSAIDDLRVRDASPVSRA